MSNEKNITSLEVNTSYTVPTDTLGVLLDNTPAGSDYWVTKGEQVTYIGDGFTTGVTQTYGPAFTDHEIFYHNGKKVAFRGPHIRSILL